jgi:hypothetical protein
MSNIDQKIELIEKENNLIKLKVDNKVLQDITLVLDEVNFIYDCVQEIESFYSNKQSEIRKYFEDNPTEKPEEISELNRLREFYEGMKYGCIEMIEIRYTLSKGVQANEELIRKSKKSDFMESDPYEIYDNAPKDDDGNILYPEEGHKIYNLFKEQSPKDLVDKINKEKKPISDFVSSPFYEISLNKEELNFIIGAYQIFTDYIQINHSHLIEERKILNEFIVPILQNIL